MDAETYELILAWRKDSLSHISPDWVSPGTLERHRSDPRGTFARAGTQYTPAEQKLREPLAPPGRLKAHLLSWAAPAVMMKPPGAR